MNLPVATPGPQPRRADAAIGSSRIGRGGVRPVASIAGLSTPTIGPARTGRAARPRNAPLIPDPRLGGRPASESKSPGTRAAPEHTSVDETAGAPMGEKVGAPNRVGRISEKPREHGTRVCGETARRRLRRMKFSVQYGKTRRAGPGRDGPEAEQQFGRIAARHPVQRTPRRSGLRTSIH